MYPIVRLTQLIPMVSRARVNWQRRLYRRQLARQIIEVPNDRIAVSYGPGIGDQLRRGEDLTGGKVKLMYLHQRYPHDSACFNILYLVSSALPCHSVELARWARKCGAIVVLNQNGVAYPAWTDDHQSINDELAEVLSQTDLVIYQSHFCKQAADRFLGQPPSMWEILPNCVDINRFAPIRKVNGGAYRLLVAGTHYQRERVILPLHVVRSLMNKNVPVHLTIAGRLAWPQAREEVCSLIHRCGLESSVTFTGPFTHAEAPLLYADHDMLLHLKYKDPCPNVVIEAMASGLPVIGSASGGLEELIGTGGGSLLPVSDSWTEMFYPTVPDLCDAILEVGKSIDEWRMITRKRAVEYFSSKDWITNHSRIFCTALGFSAVD